MPHDTIAYLCVACFTLYIFSRCTTLCNKKIVFSTLRNNRSMLLEMNLRKLKSYKIQIRVAQVLGSAVDLPKWLTCLSLSTNPLSSSLCL